MNEAIENRVPARGAVATPPPDHVRGRVSRTARPAGGAVKYAVVAVLVLAVGAGGYAAGYGIGKGTGGTASAGGFGAGGSAGGFRQRMNGGFGTVTAVSDSSITLSETRPGGTGSNAATTTTYAITGSTTVTDNGASASVSDIKTGDTVMVRTASSSSTDATSITLNPTMGGAPGAAADGTSSSTTTNAATPATT